MANPILILQMQRMGDLVLSFPLLGWLKSAYPGHPVWVLGEEHFFSPLLPLSPGVTYFSYADMPSFAGVRFHMALNLSHRPEAAAVAGSVTSDALFGPYATPSGALHIRGDWQLYRASLTHNNRYNLFHWADLNALDCIPPINFQMTDWPLPRPFAHGLAPGGDPARIGLFLGASEPEKHPDAAFWATLARQLLRAGHKPVLLGGVAEKRLGHEVGALLGAHALNLCGHFTVNALADFISHLDLLVTPDTGPMHIATWTGTPVLNLSLGPVNPWETGPFSPGHHIVRAAMDCAGCWACTRENVFCKEHMTAGRVGAVAEALLTGTVASDPLLLRSARGLNLFQTRRDTDGLFALAPLLEDAAPPGRGAHGDVHEGQEQKRLLTRRHLTALFWQAWFGGAFGLYPEQRAASAWNSLSEASPEERDGLTRDIPVLMRSLLALSKGRSAELFSGPDTWQAVVPALRPLTGYLHMSLTNERMGRPAVLHALGLAESLYGVVGR